MLQTVDVAHHGLGELGKIAVAEERQGKLAQTFCEARARMSYFVVDQRVREVILLIVREERHAEEDGDAYDERQRRRQRGAFDERRHVPLHEQVEDADARHDHEVGDHGPKRSLFDVSLTCFRKGVFLAELLSEDHLKPPPSGSSTGQLSDSRPTCVHTGRLRTPARHVRPARPHALGRAPRSCPHPPQWKAGARS